MSQLLEAWDDFALISLIEVVLAILSVFVSGSVAALKLQRVHRCKAFVLRFVVMRDVEVAYFA